MGASNFLRGDETYIYVPKIFNCKVLTYEMVTEEISFIQEAVLEKVRAYLSKLQRLQDYGIYKENEHSPSFSKDGHVISLIHFFDDGSYDENIIYFYFVNGYYMAGNFGYEVTRSEYMPKFIDKITDKVCDIIEKELKKYCDRYVLVSRASNGEALYQKVSRKKTKVKEV